MAQILTTNMKNFKLQIAMKCQNTVGGLRLINGDAYSTSAEYDGIKAVKHFRYCTNNYASVLLVFLNQHQAEPKHGYPTATHTSADHVELRCATNLLCMFLAALPVLCQSVLLD